MKVWPYCLVLIVPASVVIGTLTGGPGSFMTLVVVFGLIPLFDAVIGLNTANPNVEDEKQLNKTKGFHRVTWFFAVLQVCLVIWGIAMFAGQALTPLEQVGLILSLGTCSGGMGIVVSHELIHRIDSRLEPFLGRIALASVLYMHWAIEHIAGHHRTVATPEDPATARKGEAFYVFWPRTVMGGIQSAWRIETRRLSRSGKTALSPGNRLLRYYGIEVLLVILIGTIFGLKGVFFYIGQSVVAVLLLELVNYIEHYGLRRRKTAGKRYEPVRPEHSWNASHRLTNYLLFNLQRHADHHAKPQRRFQILRHFDESPQLPAGYATMVILALCPPLWFRIIDPRIPAQTQSKENLGST